MVEAVLVPPATKEVLARINNAIYVNLDNLLYTGLTHDSTRRPTRYHVWEIAGGAPGRSAVALPVEAEACHPL